MLLNSFVFLIFIAIFFPIHRLLNGKVRQIFFILGGTLFYLVWGVDREGITGIRWLLHLGLVAFVNYLAGELQWKYADKKKKIAAVVITLNVLNLALFKYTGFVRNTFLLWGFDAARQPLAIELFLPLAISFYTFQLIAYQADIARGTITSRVTFIDFMQFVLFFPVMIAGPILRTKDIIPQFQNPSFEKKNLYDGLWLITSGLIKKLLLADPMEVVVQQVFNDPRNFHGSILLLGGVAFSVQIFCDFSGYTDMARGVARLLGFTIPENFFAPFFSKSARELWQRWHVTLATWLRDYIYFPLGGNRHGNTRTYLNLFLTFLIGGIWHGADWNYVLWGGFWGVLLAIERFFEKGLRLNLTSENVYINNVKRLIMFALFAIGAILFRVRPGHGPEGTRSTWKMMSDYLSGIFLNMNGVIQKKLQLAGSDPLQIEMLFGKSVFNFRTFQGFDTLIGCSLMLIFFHFVQYKRGWLDRFRPYDPYLLTFAAVLFGGILFPSLAIAAHQFIYAVF